MNEITAGFSDPEIQSAQNFRLVLDAMSRPGKVVEFDCELMPPAPMLPSAAAIALTLCDHDTNIWLDPALHSEALIRYLAFHCGTPVVSRSQDANFAFIGDPAGLKDLDQFAAGTSEYPDRSATLIVQIERLASNAGIVLTGPGIENRHMLDAPPVGDAFWSALTKNNAKFPLGVDVVFAAPDRIAAIPRSSHLSSLEAV